MKALIRNEEAQAGVGTLIIFIAMVLVAAVAAAVLIQTSGTMQSKSTSTTKEAAGAISENLVVEAVDGNSVAGTTLQSLNITVRPASGSPDIDLSKVTLKVKSQSYNYSRNITNPGVQATTFKVYVLRDPDNVTGAPLGTWTDALNPALRTGALARIDADVSALTIQSKNTITIALTPEKGTTFTLQLSLPAINSGTNAIYP